MVGTVVHRGHDMTWHAWLNIQGFISSTCRCMHWHCIYMHRMCHCLLRNSGTFNPILRIHVSLIIAMQISYSCLHSDLSRTFVAAGVLQKLPYWSNTLQYRSQVKLCGHKIELQCTCTVFVCHLLQYVASDILQLNSSCFASLILKGMS